MPDISGWAKFSPKGSYSSLFDVIFRLFAATAHEKAHAPVGAERLVIEQVDDRLAVDAQKRVPRADARQGRQAALIYRNDLLRHCSLQKPAY